MTLESAAALLLHLKSSEDVQFCFLSVRTEEHMTRTEMAMARGAPFVPGSCITGM